MSPKELWHIVHQCYGTELGLTSEDDDYVSPTAEHMNGLLWVSIFKQIIIIYSWVHAIWASYRPIVFVLAW